MQLFQNKSISEKENQKMETDIFDIIGESKAHENR